MQVQTGIARAWEPCLPSSPTPSSLSVMSFRRQFMKNWYAVEVSFATDFWFVTFHWIVLYIGYPDVSGIHYTRVRIYRPCSYVIIGTVLAGGTWYLHRLATGPTSKLSRLTLHHQNNSTFLKSFGPKATALRGILLNKVHLFLLYHCSIKSRIASRREYKAHGSQSEIWEKVRLFCWLILTINF